MRAWLRCHLYWEVLRPWLRGSDLVLMSIFAVLYLNCEIHGRCVNGSGPVAGPI